MIEEFTVWNPELATDRVTSIELPEAIKRRIADRVKKADTAWGFDCSKKYHSLNNYDNDDYLFVADMLLDICELHQTMYFHPEDKKWINGCSSIPYVHLEFIEQPTLKHDVNGRPLMDDDGNFVVDDAKINMGVKTLTETGAHVLQFNYYWIKQYLRFLIELFDDNSEVTFSSPDINLKKAMRYGSISEMLTTAVELQKQGLIQQAHALRLYALSQKDKTHILWPELTFINPNTPNQIVTWVLFDEERNLLFIDLKKKIYNTSAFAGLFCVRKELLAELFVASLKMILGHEVAHVARGHWNLRMQEPQ